MRKYNGEYLDAYLKEHFIPSEELTPTPNSTYCAFCGLEFLLDDEVATLVSAHIRTCTLHPMRNLESRLTLLTEAARDALAGWNYIRRHHGDLYGVGWERVQMKLEQALTQPEAEPSSCKTCGGSGQVEYLSSPLHSEADPIHSKPCPDCSREKE